MHVPQSVTTANELVSLSSILTQIISPTNSEPIVSIDLDIALGVYRMTKNAVRIAQKSAFNLLATNTSFVDISDVQDRTYTGKQLLSTIVPKNINVRTTNKNYRGEGDNENLVVIQNGDIIQGVVDKSIYQSMTKGLVQSIYNDCGPEATRLFFDNTLRMICHWLVTSGFSVGLSDLQISQKDRESINTSIHHMKSKIYDNIRKQHHVSDGVGEDFEDIVDNIIGDTVSTLEKSCVSKIDSPNNRLASMVQSGSKGKSTNVLQMIACLGQQNVDGKRISYGFSERTLPHFRKFDEGPESRGFVENSFASGLSPHEFFFHSMGGREGLIDTAIKTSDNGYIQRKLVKAMEDAKVVHDNTVRNASGSILQFLYGEDGMDSIKIESQVIPYINYDLATLKSQYLITKNDDFEFYVDKQIIEKLHRTRGWEDRFNDHFQEIFDDREFVITKMFNGERKSAVMYPISFARIIMSTKSLFNDYDKGGNDLNPLHVLDTIETMKKELCVSQHSHGNRLLKILINAFLSPKKIIFEYKFSRLAFDKLVQEVKFKFFDGIVHPSETVGIIAAQSIGEPVTQITLNTFHLSGVASASTAVRGVPRMKELLSVTKNIRTPITTIYVKNEFKTNKERCTQILNELQTVRLRDVVETSTLYYDPRDEIVSSEMNVIFGALYKKFMNESRYIDNLSPWLLKLDLSPQKLLEHDLSVRDVELVLKTVYDVENKNADVIQTIFCDEASLTIVARVEMFRNQSDDLFSDLTVLRNNIANIKISGIDKIEKVVLSENEITKYNEQIISFEKLTEITLNTSGTNLVEILVHDEIDSTKTVSNDINEVMQVFGIEAARQALYDEIWDVISSSGQFINYRHIATLVDTMTNGGFLMSIDRFGINRGNVGPLAKCSFEETSDIIFKAGIFSETDDVNGLSANTMLGQTVPSGTGDTGILLDESNITNTVENIESLDEVVDETSDDINLDFDFSIPDELLNYADETNVSQFDMNVRVE